MGRLARTSFVLMQAVTPWIVRLVGVVGRLLVLAMVAWWAGVFQAVRNMGDEYLHRAAQAGVPSGGDPIIYYGTIALAIVELTLGWIVASYITVWIVNVILWH
jgi:hypothetical protein